MRHIAGAGRDEISVVLHLYRLLLWIALADIEFLAVRVVGVAQLLPT